MGKWGVWDHSEFYSVIAPVKDGAISESLFSTTDQTVHSSHSRAINSVFSMTSVLRYEPYLDETTELFFNRLEDISQNTDWIDLPTLFQYYAFDAIGMLAYGKRYGFIEQNAGIDGISKLAKLPKSRKYAGGKIFCMNLIAKK
ncbi:hypothetical protein TCE0_047r18112 [Talaromyces pinophilus]|uniref:Uncharacterized protein n=1 Tax=Talaromyces pinophilus TaxID=128442 RepID=A0A0B8MYS3_TALPI|nr:hypothetical protein TCE0_047r18112 [Talaromyces pinophilus]